MGVLMAPKETPMAKADPIKCSFCGKSRMDTTHMFRGHKNANAKALVCAECLKAFKQQLIDEGIIK